MQTQDESGPPIAIGTLRRLYFKNATHQLTNVTETHEKV